MQCQYIIPNEWHLMMNLGQNIAIIRTSFVIFLLQSALLGLITGSKHEEPNCIKHRTLQLSKMVCLIDW